MIDRDKKILEDSWASQHYCDVPRKYIDISFRDGVDWADSHPSNETIEKVLRLTKKYSGIGVYQQQKINMFDYIRENWNG